MKNLILLIALIMAMAAGCHSGYKNDFAVADELYEAPMHYDYAARSSAGLSQSNPDDILVGAQMLVKTAYLGIEVNSYDEARLLIDSLIRLSKGWVSSENLYNYDYRISNELTIRVPSSNLDTLLLQLTKIAKKVDFQRIETSDVTEEYIDVESRLKNQQLVEQKFLNLLRRTDSIDEILKIETKLADVRAQIESAQGRIKYLNNRVNFSTVNLSIYQKIDFKYVPETMDSFWERLKKSVDKGWKGFVTFILFLIRLWPFWVVGSIAWFAVRWTINRKKIKPIAPKKKKKAKEKEKVRAKAKKVPKNDAVDQMSE